MLDNFCAVLACNHSGYALLFGLASAKKNKKYIMVEHRILLNGSVFLLKRGVVCGLHLFCMGFIL